MAKDEYVNTTGLYKMKNQASHEKSNDDTSSRLGREKQFSKAVQERHNEYLKLKRDVTSRYEESIVTLSEKLEGIKNAMQIMDDSLGVIKEKQEKLGALKDNWEEDNYTAELATSVKSVENLRIELIRQNARLAEVNGSEKGGIASTGSLLPEIGSLSFKQLFRMGFMFLLPLLLVVGIGAVIVALAVFFSMRF